MRYMNYEGRNAEGGQGCCGCCRKNRESAYMKRGYNEGEETYPHWGMHKFRYYSDEPDLKEKLKNYRDDLEEEIKYIDKRIKEIDDADSSSTEESKEGN
ncbi:MAG: DUF5320 domain-containing protein [Candidatus Micrarchaeaceae archaeon]